MPSLVRKIMLPASALVGVFALLIALMVFQARAERELLRAEAARLRDQSEALFQLYALLSETDRIILEYRLAPSPRLRDQLRASDVKAAALLDDLSGSLGSERGRALVRRLEQGRGSMQRERDRLLDAVTGPPEQYARAERRWRVHQARHHAAVADVNVYGIKHLSAALRQVEAKQATAQALFVMLLAAAALGAAALGYYLYRSVAVPLSRFSRAAEVITKERSTQRVAGEERQDEIGTLARSFNTMTEQLLAANRELQQAVELRDQFLSIASHELRTPLTSMKLQVEISRRHLGPDAKPEAARSLTALGRQVDRLAVLVQDLLDVSRLQTGRLALMREPTDLAEVVRHVLERFAAELEAADVPVEAELAAPVQGSWDSLRLDQVVTNLLSNVVKYAPGAPLRVRVEQEGAVARLVLRDHGPGIPRVQHGELFQRFVRLAPTGTRGGGLGLGLYIAREIVRAHGGQIRIDGDVGQGTAFTVELPR